MLGQHFLIDLREFFLKFVGRWDEKNKYMYK